MNEIQRDKVVAMFIEKCGILANGYGKRGKYQGEEHYRNLAARYSKPVEGLVE